MVWILFGITLLIAANQRIQLLRLRREMKAMERHHQECRERFVQKLREKDLLIEAVYQQLVEERGFVNANPIVQQIKGMGR